MASSSQQQFSQQHPNGWWWNEELGWLWWDADHERATREWMQDEYKKIASKLAFAEERAQVAERKYKDLMTAYLDLQVQTAKAKLALEDADNTAKRSPERTAKPNGRV